MINPGGNASDKLKAENIIFSFDKEPVLKDITLDIEHSSFIGLIGPNGAGKTTLLHILSGQLKPETGSVVFKGEDIYLKNLEFKKQIGFVHEEPFFYPYMTVKEFMYFLAGLKSIHKSEQETMISILLKSVSLFEEKDKLTNTLSMRMKKKLSIAGAMIGQPKILFLDEALNGIDIESAYNIKQILTDFAANGGTIIISTHVLEVLEKICDRYIVLKAGEILAQFSADDFNQEKNTNSNIDLEKRIIQLLNGE